MAAVVVGLAGLATTSFAATDDSLVIGPSGLTDDFEDGNATGWSKSGGGWSVGADGTKVLRQTKTGATLARQFTGDDGWTDYAVQARVKPVAIGGADGYAAVVARASSSTTFYRLSLSGANTVRLESVKSGAATVVSSAALTVSPGAWYTLSLSVTGSTIAGSVNGAQIVQGASSGLGAGRAGLQTYNATASFDDVAVTLGGAAPAPAPVPTTAAPSASPSAPPSASPSTSPFGFETSPIGFGAGTTGGAGGATVTITSLSQACSHSRVDSPTRPRARRARNFALCWHSLPPSLASPC